MIIYSARKLRTITASSEYTAVGEETPFDTDVQDSITVAANSDALVLINPPLSLNGKYPLVFLGMVADGYNPAVTVDAPPQVIAGTGSPVEIHIRNTSGSTADTGNIRLLFAEVDKTTVI